MASFNDLIKQKVPVLVDFKADWCVPCKMIAPILVKVKKELKDKVKIIKIDVDKNPNIARTYQVKGVPTLILFKNGTQIWRQSGVIPANQLIQIINKYY